MGIRYPRWPSEEGSTVGGCEARFSALTYPRWTGLSVQGLGFRVQGSGSRVQG